MAARRAARAPQEDLAGNGSRGPRPRLSNTQRNEPPEPGLGAHTAIINVEDTPKHALMSSDNGG